MAPGRQRSRSRIAGRTHFFQLPLCFDIFHRLMKRVETVKQIMRCGYEMLDRATRLAWNVVAKRAALYGVMLI